MTIEEIKAPEIDHRRTTRQLMKGGIALTVAWLIIAAALLWWKRNSLAGLELNQWGDFLAGVSAPLALLWLVLGYFQQGLELQQNTEALRLQYEELRRQVGETAALARSAERHASAAEQLVKVTDSTAERAAKHAAALIQPNFMSGASSRGADSGVMDISNSGARVVNIKFYKREDGGAETYLTHTSIWPSGGKCSLQVANSQSYPFTLRIEYTDTHEIQRSQWFEVPRLGVMLVRAEPH